MIGLFATAILGFRRQEPPPPPPEVPWLDQSVVDALGMPNYLIDMSVLELILFSVFVE